MLDESAVFSQITKRIPTERKDSVIFRCRSKKIRLILGGNSRCMLILASTALVIVVTENGARQAVSSSKNWSGHGLDRVQNPWYNKFSSIYSRLAYNIKQVIGWVVKSPPDLPEASKNDMVWDLTYSIPITCLSIPYKFIAFIISGRISANFDTIIITFCLRNTKVDWIKRI